MTKKLLILEDDTETVAKLLTEIAILEERLRIDIDVTVLSNYLEVERVANPQPASAYDLILLDRDCKMAGSFHILDIEKFGPEKIIAISSTPQWNEEAAARGVKDVVLKDYSKLDEFAKAVIAKIEAKMMST